MASFGIATLIFCQVLITPVLSQSAMIEPRDCPLQCACSDYSIHCKQVTVFPENLPEVTQNFILSDSEIDSIPSNVFLNLNYLANISITDVKINKIMACAFAELDGVSIRFHNVDIEVIEGNSFSNIVNSSGIMFHESNIQQMKSFAFHNLKNIFIIELMNSHIGTIHPYAFQHVENVSDFSLVNSSVDRFLKKGFSRFNDVEFTYILRSTIKEWQCGSVDLGIDNIFVSASALTCDCSLAWLWKLHPNSSIIHEGSNRCYGSDFMLGSLAITDICGKEDRQMSGCPQLLPSSPHTCTRKFDTPFVPEPKVEYPKYFSQPENVATTRSLSPVLLVIGVLTVLY